MLPLYTAATSTHVMSWFTLCFLSYRVYTHGFLSLECVPPTHVLSTQLSSYKTADSAHIAPSFGSVPDTAALQPTLPPLRFHCIR